MGAKSWHLEPVGEDEPNRSRRLARQGSRGRQGEKMASSSKWREVIQRASLEARSSGKRPASAKRKPAAETAAPVSAKRKARAGKARVITVQPQAVLPRKGRASNDRPASAPARPDQGAASKKRVGAKAPAGTEGKVAAVAGSDGERAGSSAKLDRKAVRLARIKALVARMAPVAEA